MNWNANCEPDLIAQHQCLTLVSEYEQIPADMFQHPVESFPEGVEDARKDRLPVNAIPVIYIYSVTLHTFAILYVYIAT